MTLLEINKKLEKKGYVLYKNKNYFYFNPLNYKNVETPFLKDSSIMENSLKKIGSFEAIEKILNEKIIETKESNTGYGGLKIIN